MNKGRLVAAMVLGALGAGGLLSHCAAAEGRAELLANAGFEGATASLAPAWSENTWTAAGENQRPHVSWGLDTKTVHSGRTSQRIQIAQLVRGGGTALFQNFDFPAGGVYEGRVWLRAAAPMKVRVVFRKRSFFYTTGAARVLRVGDAWQEVIIRGGYPTDTQGQLLIQPVEPGTLYVDDASLKELTAEVLREPVALADPIDRSFFGMHINKLGSHNTWPGLSFGTLRLWDTGTNWAAVEPSQGAIALDDNWRRHPSPGFRLTYYLRHQQKHDPQCQVIYTMGVTPLWAAAKPEPRFQGGSASPPRNLDDWRAYVRAVGKRFGSQIRCWEIWNEADQGHQYHGDAQTMCDMTRIAHEELKAVRPDCLILSPNITSFGVAFLDEFLELGGGRFVDVISWHHYPTLQPELGLPALVSVRDVMRRHGIDKPLWNTEGKPGGDPGVPGVDGSPETIATETARAAVARAHLVQWAYGVRVFCWYMFDEAAGQSCIRLSRSTEGAARPDYAVLTPAGETYNELARWLLGATMIGKTVERSTSQGQRWTLEIARNGGYRGWIVWDTGGSSEMAVAGTWRIERIRALDGSAARPASARVAVGSLPLLLENRAPVE